MTTIRAEFHRLRPNASSIPVQEVGNRVFQVFEGSATIKVGDEVFEARHGDIVNVPSWKLWSVEAGSDGVDLFCFSDHPIFEALHLARTYSPKGN